MLPVVVRLHAFQELRMELLEAFAPTPATPVCVLSSSKRSTT
jgi:hypothetical protein